MNQKIGLNTLKRSMVASQVCKISRSAWKGEFVVERKEASTPSTEEPAPSTEAQAPAQEAPVAPSAPLSQEQKAFVQPQPSAKTLQPVPRPKNWHFLSINNPKLGPQLEDLSQWCFLLGSFSFRWTKRRWRLVEKYGFKSYHLWTKWKETKSQWWWDHQKGSQGQWSEKRI